MQKRIIILFLILFGIVATLQAQQIPVYSQFFLNRFLINPARTGAYGFTEVDLTAREQWVGFRGAPSTNALSFQTRMLKQSFMKSSKSPRTRYTGGKSSGGNVGIGGYIFSDQSGIMNYTGAQGNYAYHIRMKESQLSFGVSMNMIQFSVDKENIILFDKDDETVSNTNLTMYIPDAAAGVYFVYPNFYAGLSATQLFQSLIKFGNIQNADAKLLRHYYFMTGYNFRINDVWDVEPSMLIKTTEQLYNQIDLNARVFYTGQFWAGMSYRTGSFNNIGIRDAGALIAMGGVSVDIFSFGYAFDFTFNNIQKFNYGSHEINFSVRLGSSARRYRWIDRY